MDWRMDDTSSSYRVSPFRHLRIKDYLHLPAAFRSLSRLSSALSAKASTLRSLYLDHFHMFPRNILLTAVSASVQAFRPLAGSWFSISRYKHCVYNFMFCLLFRKFPYRISSDVLNILYSRCLFQCVVFNEQRRKCVNIYDLRVIRRFLLRTIRCFLIYVSHPWQTTLTEWYLISH